MTPLEDKLQMALNDFNSKCSAEGRNGPDVACTNLMYSARYQLLNNTPPIIKGVINEWVNEEEFQVRQERLNKRNFDGPKPAVAPQGPPPPHMLNPNLLPPGGAPAAVAPPLVRGGG